MGSPPQHGYHAVFSGLRSRSARADYTVDLLHDLRERLSRTFTVEGNPLGRDQYGEALAKERYKIEDAVFNAFWAHIDEMERLRDGLRGNARNYEDAEDHGNPGDAGDDPANPEGW
ncbi:hypothetical protein Nocox_02275 [Nonomuraea coxensis DSM 45129]|uniref:Uncharacterized protein n=1 Tax=Nonomuraea coxensis DSM 45129 TaxID=1122611 RepID=A0ABX8TRT7_9ACTN|nr:hypothetical protein [Nonomuraea coxensis]QYC38088.1 hypothetical protein Nocox_02275 [Nonomuraea coxensis DSM 45129]